MAGWLRSQQHVSVSQGEERGGEGQAWLVKVPATRQCISETGEGQTWLVKVPATRQCISETGEGQTWLVKVPATRQCISETGEGQTWLVKVPATRQCISETGEGRGRPGWLRSRQHASVSQGQGRGGEGQAWLVKVPATRQCISETGEGQTRVRFPLVPVHVFAGPVTTVTSVWALRWPPCQAAGVIGSMLGLVGLVLVFRDWVRQ